MKPSVLPKPNTTVLRDKFSRMYSVTPALTDNSKQVATTEYVTKKINLTLGLSDSDNINDVVISGTTKPVILNGPSVLVGGDLITKRIILLPL